MKKSNFSFIPQDWGVLADLAEMAEKNLYTDPNTSLIKLRMFGETLTKYIFAFEEITD